ETVGARRVVVACGAGNFAHLPPELAHLPPELASHTACHRDLGRFPGRDVTVIGAGQSALESAALLAERGATVRLLVRGDALVWNEDPVLERPLRVRVREPLAGLGAGWKIWALSNH